MADSKKIVLVAGGAGFIGSHLCDRLIQDKAVVICVDDFLTGHHANIDHLLRNPDFILVRHNIVRPLNLEAVPELQHLNLAVSGIDEVYNLASPTTPKNFEENIMHTLLANSQGTLNTLNIAKKYKAKFLLASSSVVYGGATEGGAIFDEKTVGLVDNLTPRASYDEGKRFAETMAMTFHQFYELDVKIARVFRTYGPRMALHHGHLIPDFIMNAIDGRELIIYGAEDATTTFCYVSDIVDGLVKLMNSEVNGVMNVGAPDNYLIRDIAEYIIALLQSDSKIVHKKDLPYMKPLGLPNISFAREKIGWFPIVTMAEGLRQTVEYTLANKDLVSFVKE
jgi:UDP-glucuronate decarboxylase